MDSLLYIVKSWLPKPFEFEAVLSSAPLGDFKDTDPILAALLLEHVALEGQ